MKRICTGLAAVAALGLLSGCASSGGAQKSSGSTGSAGGAYVIKSGDGVVGYYTFDEAIDDNEVVDHSGLGINVYTAALDGSVQVEGKVGDGLSFNGEDEYITLEGDVLDGDGFTFAAWLKPNAWKDWTRVFDIGDTTEDMWCGMDFETKKLRFDVIGGKGSCSLLADLPATGTWTHVAATLGNGKAAIYVDGKLADEKPVAVTVANIAANVQGIFVGRSNWPDPLFDGVMDEVLVANRAFSAKEIAAVKNGIVAPGSDGDAAEAEAAAEESEESVTIDEEASDEEI
ncbi:MAG: LamG domain-containing protein [Treponema sp.]|nr:LamG domain-containing protein [Treponema sp.]